MVLGISKDYYSPKLVCLEKDSNLQDLVSKTSMFANFITEAWSTGKDSNLQLYDFKSIAFTDFANCGCVVKDSNLQNLPFESSMVASYINDTW